MTIGLEWEHVWPGTELAPGEIHLGRLLVQRADPQYERYLSRDEIERASSFHFDVDRSLYVASRGALRSLLATYLDTEPHLVQIVIDTGGKPHLSEVAHPDPVQFNISHAKSLVLIGITRDMPIGVDVEETRPDIPIEDMAARFFSPSELAAFESRPVEDRIDYFFAVWTRKEAYIKGIGEGLAIAPDAFSVTVEGRAAPVDDPSRPDRWWTGGVDVFEGFEAALALPRDDWSLRPFEIAAAGD